MYPLVPQSMLRWVDRTEDLAVLDWLQVLPTLEEMQAPGALGSVADSLEGGLMVLSSRLREAARPVGCSTTIIRLCWAFSCVGQIITVLLAG